MDFEIWGSEIIKQTSINAQQQFGSVMSTIVIALVEKNDDHKGKGYIVDKSVWYVTE